MPATLMTVIWDLRASERAELEPVEKPSRSISIDVVNIWAADLYGQLALGKGEDALRKVCSPNGSRWNVKYVRAVADHIAVTFSPSIKCPVELD